MKKKTAIVLALLVVGLLLGSSLWGQGLHLKGQLWTSITRGDDPADGRSDVEETIGYIPTLSLTRKLGPMSLVDVEVAYYLSAVLDGAFGRGEVGVQDAVKPYRLWGRFATEKLELRLGLQKITFGPGIVLRPLIWFDTWDITDPTGQTEGVGALRLKWYPYPRLAFWGWVIRPDRWEDASLGGRVEYTFGPGELAVTYHRRAATDLEYSGTPLVSPLQEEDRFALEEDRFALDLRLDWIIGLWTEAVRAQAIGSVERTDMAMIGCDYTLDWGNGVYVMAEHLWTQLRYSLSADDMSRQVSLFLASYPLGFTDQLMAILVYDWEGEHQSLFFQWQRTYDNYSLSLILFDNPRRREAQNLYQQGLSPESLASAGTGIQIIIVFNH